MNAPVRHPAVSSPDALSHAAYADAIEAQAQARASEAIQTIAMMLSVAEMQLAALGDVKRNGGLRFTGGNRARLAGNARALADALEALS